MNEAGKGWVEWRCPISLIAEGWGKGERGNVWFISWALVQTSYSSKFVIGLEVTFRTEMEPDRDVGCGWRRRGGLSFRLHSWSIYHWSDIMCHQLWPNITIWSRSGQRFPASTLKSWASKSLSTGPKMHHEFLWVIQKYVWENICSIINVKYIMTSKA